MLEGIAATTNASGRSSKARKELIMEQRLNYPRLAPEAARAMYGLGSYLARCGLEHSLLELVKIRASQINGCAFCIDMHTKDARAARRDGAADLRAERLAGDAVLHRPGARGPGLDRGRHAHRRRGARRPLRGGEAAVLREGAGRT